MHLLLVVPIATGLSDPFAYPPMGPLMIGAVCEQAGHQVEIIFAHWDGMTVRYGTTRDLTSYQRRTLSGYDVVGVNLFAEATFDAGCAVLLDIPEGTWSIAGGAFVTSAPEETIDAGFQIGVMDEGEATITELLPYLNGRQAGFISMTGLVSVLCQIPGLAFQDPIGSQEGQIITTPHRPYIQPLDSLPPPAWHLLDASLVAQRTPTHLAADRISTTLFATRGCPFDCNFCLVPSTVIETKRGPMAIEEIKPLMLVRTHTGAWQRVTKVYTHQHSSSVYCLRYHGGSVTLTAEHPVAMVEAEGLRFTEAARLHVGEQLQVWQDERFQAVSLIAVDRAGYTGPVYNLAISEDHSYMANGLVVGNCNREVFGRLFRTHSPEYLVSHLRWLREHYGINHVRFPDDMLTTSKKWVFQLCNALKGEDVTWVALSRTDTLDAEMALTMADAGCVGLFFGVESGSQRILDLMNKRNTVEQNGEAIRLCRAAHLISSCYFIFGFPGENAESVEETLTWLRQYRPDRIHYSTFLPIHGTDPYNHPEKYAIQIKRNYREWLYYSKHDLPVDYLPPNPSNADMLQLRNYFDEEFLALGYRSWAEKAPAASSF